VDRPGAPSDFRVFSRVTSANQQNLSYTEDPVGNVTSITDGLGTASRNFQYDDLNHLSYAHGTSISSQLKQIQEHPGRYDADIFIRLKRQKMLVSCYDELRKAFDGGFNVLVIIRICGNRMNAQISVHRLGDKFR
jgi:hypothetical protein